LLFFSFPKEFGDAPQQDISRFTGYEAWHPKVIGYSFQMSDAMTFFAFITTGAAAYLSLKWTEKPPPNKRYASHLIKNGVKVSTLAFNRVIAYYIAITFICVAAYMILDVGKLWSATGVLHNVFEIAIMLILNFGGKIKSHALRDDGSEIPLTEDDIIQTEQATGLDCDFYPNTVHHPYQLWLLILASVAHLIGNIGNSIWVDSGLA
ncbi:339_t:CDS:2, partial [Dentiscutata erythropus]